MSITFSVVLLLLSLSSHACNARIFGVVHNDPARGFHYSISKENDHQKLNPGGVSIQPDGKKSSPGDAKTENRLREINVDGEYNEVGKNSKAKGDRVEDSSLRKIWRLRRRKRSGEQEPGFNLDYLPPKTHPPVHN